MSNYRELIRDHQAEIMRALLDGERRAEVAKSLGVSATVLHRHMTALGYKLPDGRKYRPARRSKAEDTAHQALFEAAMAELMAQRRNRHAWLCFGCGEEYTQNPDQCPKCQSTAFEEVEIAGIYADA